MANPTMSTWNANGTTFDIRDTNAAAAIDAHTQATNNPHGVTIAQIGAAPAGYGLGEEGQHVPITDVAEIDNIKANGWYAVTQQVGSPLRLANVLFNVLSLEVSMMLSNYGKQVVTFTDGYVIRRIMDAGVWQPWEWENPPMAQDVEYRTTERWNGKAVYTKLVYYGAMPNNAIVSVAHGAAATRMLRVSGTFDNGKVTLPYNSYNDVVDIFANITKVYIQTNCDMSNQTAHAQIWYTKD